jgi:hypothetical protein
MNRPYVWRRTGILVCLVAGFILLVFILVGPVVYLCRRIHLFSVAHNRPRTAGTSTP